MPRIFSVKHATKDTLTHLEAFMASPDFKKGVIQATEYEPTGGCNVELFEDGTWSIAPMIGVGNLYESPGVFLPLPVLEGSYIDDGGEIATHPLERAFNFEIHRMRAKLFDTYEDLIWLYGSEEAQEPIGNGIPRCNWCRDKGVIKCTVGDCEPNTWWCDEHYPEFHIPDEEDE